MTTEKQLGIWMDHSNAQLIEFANDSFETKTISSGFTHNEKEHSLSKSEHVMHNKEQHKHAEYYKKLGEEIRNYGDVIIFGPTSAKAELYNTLKEDHNFSKIKIRVLQADKMTNYQQQAFVKDYFSKQ
ncbi:MAG: hypothetical protein H0U95_10300 [Bacteroidetes bacterium]|nr:hypothetical protein [Bacteroidota bacterium]